MLAKDHWLHSRRHLVVLRPPTHTINWPLESELTTESQSLRLVFAATISEVSLRSNKEESEALMATWQEISKVNCTAQVSLLLNAASTQNSWLGRIGTNTHGDTASWDATKKCLALMLATGPHHWYSISESEVYLARQKVQRWATYHGIATRRRPWGSGMKTLDCPAQLIWGVKAFILQTSHTCLANCLLDPDPQQLLKYAHTQHNLFSIQIATIGLDIVPFWGQIGKVKSPHKTLSRTQGHKSEQISLLLWPLMTVANLWLTKHK